MSNLKQLSHELDGVVADVEQGDGFDEVCLATVKRVRATLADEADPNAAWLSDAHALCADQGIPPGRIADRIKALRERLAQPADHTVDANKMVGVQPVARVSSAAGRIADAIKEVLLHHRMSHTVDDDGDALPLIDMLCQPGSNDTSTGRDEITFLVDSIYNEVLVTPQQPAEQFRPDWMNYKQGFADGKAELEQDAELSDTQIEALHWGEMSNRDLAFARAIIAADRAARGEKKWHPKSPPAPSKSCA